MKVLEQDSKEGYMKIEVESDSDLWHLRHVVEESDVLRAEDQRTTIEGGEKRHCTLKLEVEKLDYQGNRLRATGEILEAPEGVQRGYHTFNLERGVTFEIWKKKWKEYQLERVKEASETRDYEILVCMIDKEGATFSAITERGIEDVTEIESGIPGKMYRDEGNEEDFYGQVISVLEESVDVDRIIVAGPGFEKQNLEEKIEESYPEIAGKVVLEDASNTGKSGVQEVIKRGAVKRIMQESRISREVEAVEELLEHINRDDGLCTYGMEEVKRAVDMGAVERLLINDVLVRDNEGLMEEVEEKGGEVSIIHEDHDSGKKLASLGGIAAILRYETG